MARSRPRRVAEARSRATRAIRAAVLALALVLSPRTARADPSPEELGHGPGADDARSSAPGEESGVVSRARDPAQAALVVPRFVLAIPETVVRLATEPLRLLVHLEDRYHVAEHLQRFFFNDSGTFGIFPTFFFETGFGANVGLRLVHRDLFGRGENLALRAGFGGAERQIYAARIDSGERLGDAQLTFDGGFAISNRRRFYTLGNRDEVDPEDVHVRLDASDADVAVRSKYVEKSVFGSLRFDVEVADGFAVAIGERIRHRWFGIGSGVNESFPWITDAYAAQSIVGFVDQSDAYTDAHARFDRTRSDTDSLPTRGGRIDVWGGYQAGIGNPYRFGRVGGDVQGFVPLFGGDRVLRLRLRLASVLGEDARIPFLDLPTLGGALLLRGYQRDRFRDRMATVTTVEYQFPVIYSAGAYVFVDAGRAFHDFGELVSGPPRIGFGGGLVAFRRSSFLMAIQVASSIDGGVLLHVNLSATDALGDLE